MERISTQNSYDIALRGIYSAQNREVSAEHAVSSGYKASDIKGYASQAEALTATQTLKSRLDAYVSNGTVLADKLSGQNEALGALSTAVSGANTAVLNAIATGDASTLGATLQSYYSQAVDALNTTYQNGYLFGGGSQVPPVAVSDVNALANPATLASVFKNGDKAATSRLDDNITITTGVTASAAATSTLAAFKAVADYVATYNATIPAPTTPAFTKPATAAQISFLQTLVAPSTPTGSFSGASRDVIDAVARNGVVQQQLTRVNKEVADQQSAAEVAIAHITSADVAQADSDLTLAQAALSASAQVFTTLKNSSLLTALAASGGA